MHEPRPTAGLAPAPRAGVPTTRAGRVAMALVAALVAALLAGLPSAAGVGAGPAAPAEALTRVVVQAQQDVGTAAAAVAARGGRVLEVLAPFGIVVADVPAGAVAAVEADAATAAVTEDVPLRVQSADDRTIGKAKGHPAKGHPRSTARANVGDATAGDGVGIVVVDTGIADHADLEGRVAARYDLASRRGSRHGNGAHNGNGNGQSNAVLDPHGHGTFLAGIAAGSGASSGGAYAGVAPSAHLVSVRVAEPDGSTTLARVLHGLAVADVARVEHDAPVVLLALAGPTSDVPDPLMMVLEMLWSRGSTVVVASGNQGEELTSPGADPYLLTAGAFGDDNETPTLDDPSDDSVPEWSSRGDTFGAKPDLVAPGISVVGLRSRGSTIDVANTDARVGEEGDEDYFVGSGTSMAAAWTAGAAAAVIADDSDLGPDEVKGRLMHSAAPAPAGTDALAAGAGVLDLEAALDSDLEWEPANTALPSLPKAINPDHTDDHVTDQDELRRTANGVEPAAWSWTAWSWTAWSWTGWEWTTPEDVEGEWVAWSWTDGEWTAWSWTEQDWSAWSWTEQNWTEQNWTAWSWTAYGWGGAGA